MSSAVVNHKARREQLAVEKRNCRQMHRKGCSARSCLSSATVTSVFCSSMGRGGSAGATPRGSDSCHLPLHPRLSAASTIISARIEQGSIALRTDTPLPAGARSLLECVKFALGRVLLLVAEGAPEAIYQGRIHPWLKSRTRLTAIVRQKDRGTLQSNPRYQT